MEVWLLLKTELYKKKIEKYQWGCCKRLGSCLAGAVRDVLGSWGEGFPVCPPCRRGALRGAPKQAGGCHPASPDRCDMCDMCDMHLASPPAPVTSFLTKKVVNQFAPQDAGRRQGVGKELRPPPPLPPRLAQPDPLRPVWGRGGE